MERYFAYGSNLNLNDLEKWCQRLGRPSALTGRAVPAWLPDHDVAFDYYSASRRGGVLDLLPAVGKVVPGALFDVVEEDLRTLDLKDGAPLIYRRTKKKVLLADGAEVEAQAYSIGSEDRSPAPVTPMEGYVDVVAEGLAAFGHDDRMVRAAARGESTPYLVTGLFVYGTLLHGGSRHAEFERCGGTVDVVGGTAPGVLLDCGSFPGMIPGPGGTVHGEIVGLRDVAAALAHLDGVEGYEGFDAARALFRRALLTVQTEAGSRIAWAYLWAGGERHPRIASGDWRGK